MLLWRNTDDDDDDDQSGSEYREVVSVGREIDDEE